MDYTLLIPTYNRPQDLARLLRYLATAGAAFPIMVLDSSRPDVMAQNRQTVAGSGLSARHIEFAAEIHPFQKFLAGCRKVETAYCSLCADDDFVLLPALKDSVAALTARTDAAAAHGNYFNFSETINGFNLSYVVQSGNRIEDATPAARVRRMLSNYEVLFYAVFRTSHFISALESLGQFQTTLAAEVWLAGATAAAGSVLRVDRFYLGRNTGVSLSPDAWHPHEIMSKFPERLLVDLPRLQDHLVSAMRRAGAQEDEALLRQMVELLWLRYLAPFLRADAVDFILDRRLAGMDGRRTLEEFWDTFVNSTRSIHPMVPLNGRDGQSYAPEAMRDGYSPRDYFHDAVTPQGERRRYNIYFEFLFPDLKPPCRTAQVPLQELLTVANLY